MSPMGRRKKEAAFISYVDIVSSSYVPHKDYVAAQRNYVDNMDSRRAEIAYDVDISWLEDEDDGD